MDFKQLRALVTVAETGNVTRAAALLNIVQPAVSRQLRLLEEDIGAELFDRSRRGMELTEAGRTLVEYARWVLGKLDQARAEIQPTPGGIGGIVVVGLLPSTCDLLSSTLVGAVAQKYPGIRLRIATAYAGTLQSWLESAELDLALLYAPKHTAAIRIKPLLEEDLWVVGLPAAGLDAGTPYPVRDLAKHPLVLPSAPHGLRLLVEQAANLQGIPLNVVAETNAMSVQKILVRGGHGMTVLPTIAIVEEIAAGLFVAAPLIDPPMTRTIVLATSSSRHTATSVRCVATELVSCMKRAISAGQWPAARWLDQ